MIFISMLVVAMEIVVAKPMLYAIIHLFLTDIKYANVTKEPSWMSNH